MMRYNQEEILPLFQGAVSSIRAGTMTNTSNNTTGRPECVHHLEPRRVRCSDVSILLLVQAKSKCQQVMPKE